jgi:hypothetical protein
MNRASQRLLNLGKRCEVYAYIPPQYAQDLADDRTEGLVRYFWEATRGMTFIQAYDCVGVLVRSAYLQGVNDTAVAMAKMGSENLTTE